MGGSKGEGTGGQEPPGIARLLIFAMLKFSVRPLLGIWTPSPLPMSKFSGSAHAKHRLKRCERFLIVYFMLNLMKDLLSELKGI